MGCWADFMPLVLVPVSFSCCSLFVLPRLIYCLGTSGPLFSCSVDAVITWQFVYALMVVFAVHSLAAAVFRSWSVGVVSLLVWTCLGSCLSLVCVRL